MLAFYQRWAHRLYPLRWLFVLLTMLALSAFIGLLIVGDELSRRWQLSAVVLTVSAMLLWLWAALFSRPLAQASAESSLWYKLKCKLLYWAYYLLAAFITLLLLATVYLGLRTLKGIIAFLFFS